MRNRTSRRGGTLTELMVATVILSIGVLGMFGAFKFIARTTLISRGTSLATNLGQERIESLKNLSYYALQITTASQTLTVGATNYLYDTANYPPETIQIGGVTFQRYTYVGMAEMTGSNISDVAFTYPDTGLKQITVHTVWTESGNTKIWSLRNLLENPNVSPLDATITGTVSNAAGGVVASAIVVTEQNENWGATANSLGVYTFSVYHGTYTIRASSAGFSDAISGSISASKGGTVTRNLTLTPVATGYISGTAWINTGLVVSQVVAATNTQNCDGTTHDIEYVELFNPTTYPINIGTTDNAFPKPISLMYNDYTGLSTYDYGPTSWVGWGMVNVSTYVPPGYYYLIANASYFYIAGGWVRANAYYTDPATVINSASTPPPTFPDNIRNDRAAMIGLYSWAHGVWQDYVGWKDNNASNSPWWYEGTIIPDAGGGNNGLGTPLGKQIVRVSSPGINASMLPNYGRAYDSGSNARDFLYEGSYFNSFTEFIAPKSTASGVFMTISGKVPTVMGTTYVSSSDPNSGSTTAWTTFITSGALSLPYSRFQLGGVSTGTWTVTASYSGYTGIYENVAVTQGGYTGIPNATTTPPWSAVGASAVQLTSTTSLGFVKGTITNPNNIAITGITVEGGGNSKVTGSNGVYFMSVTTGNVTIIANPNNLSPSYVQGIDAVAVTEGAVTTKNFTLASGGKITGYITTGTTPLAFQAVTAVSAAGLQVGAGVTDTDGYFTIRNVSTTTAVSPYTVSPVLESGQDANPNTLPAALTSTSGDIFVGTFTVNGAFGNIAGTITDASGLVTSGALILASTNSIAASPAAIVASSAPAQVPMYMVSSKADGTYLLPVRGGAATYNLSAYVPVISALGTVSITTKTYSGISVSASATTTKNVTIP